MKLRSILGVVADLLGRSQARQRLLFAAIVVNGMLLATSAAMAQTQMGADIDGENPGDQFGGRSVALSSDGSRLAAGAPYWGLDEGNVRIFQWSGEAWAQLGSGIQGQCANDYASKVSLSSDGNRVAIGAAGCDGQETGHVRVYQWSDAEWGQLGDGIIGEAAGDQASWIALAGNGSRLAVGSSRNNNRVGHVRVFEWSGSEWIQLGDDIDGEAEGDFSGSRISLSADGNRLAVGASQNDGNGEKSGHVRVFEWSGSSWMQLGSDLDGKEADDRFGGDIWLSPDGSTLAASAQWNDEFGENSGYVQVYRWTGTLWAQLGADIHGEAGDFCCDVSLSNGGQRLAVSGFNSIGTEGQIKVYQWSGSDWEQSGATIVGEALDDRLGEEALALSADGNVLAAGSRWNSDNGPWAGHVRVYDLSMFNVFQITPALNDAWVFDDVTRQGFLFTVLPQSKLIFLAWFTFDTERPPESVDAILGDPGHRWLTALGPFEGNHAILDIEHTTGGIFDTNEIIPTQDYEGTIELEFDDCRSGTFTYDIPSLGLSRTIGIARAVDENAAACEAQSGLSLR